MSMTVGRRIVIGFAVPLVLLAIVVAVASVALRRLSAEMAAGSTQQELLLESSRVVRGAVRDAEREMLDYLLTGDPARATARQGHIAEARKGLDGMRRVTGLEGDRLSGLAGEFDEWVKLTDPVVARGAAAGHRGGGEVPAGERARHGVRPAAQWHRRAGRRAPVKRCEPSRPRRSRRRIAPAPRS